MMVERDLLLVVIPVVMTGIITWCIVYRNRNISEKNTCIDRKNQFLRDWERRALYIWSGEKGINLNLECSYLVSDIYRIEDQYKELKERYGIQIPDELWELRNVVDAENIEELLNSPESPASIKLATIVRDRIKGLTKTLESIPPK